MKASPSSTVSFKLRRTGIQARHGAFWPDRCGFYIITTAVIIGIVYYIQKHAKGQILLGTALGLMLGGAVGNFIDRVFRQEVVDFIHVTIVNYHYPIFNIADSSLCVGVLLLFIQMLLDGKKKKEL